MKCVFYAGNDLALLYGNIVNVNLMKLFKVELKESYLRHQNDTTFVSRDENCR